MLNSEELRKKLLTCLMQKKHEFAMRSMHFRPRLLEGRELLSWSNKYKVSKKTFLVVVNEARDALCTHPLGYKIHKQETGKNKVIIKKYPIKKTELISTWHKNLIFIIFSSGFRVSEHVYMRINYMLVNRKMEFIQLRNKQVNFIRLFLRSLTSLYVFAKRDITTSMLMGNRFAKI